MVGSELEMTKDALLSLVHIMGRIIQKSSHLPEVARLLEEARDA